MSDPVGDALSNDLQEYSRSAQCGQCGERNFFYRMHCACWRGRHHPVLFGTLVGCAGCGILLTYTQWNATCVGNRVQCPQTLTGGAASRFVWKGRLAWKEDVRRRRRRDGLLVT